MITGTVLWYDKRDGQGVALDAEGREYYIDRSVTDYPEYLEDGVTVTFRSRKLGGCICGFDVVVNLYSALARLTRVVERLKAEPAEHLRPGAVDEIVREREDLLSIMASQLKEAL
jgi:hypothetical protein